jgi:hypothetical protein
LEGYLGVVGVWAGRRRAAGLDPVAAAARCGARYEGDGESGVLTLPFCGRDFALAFPGLEFAPDAGLPPHVQALLVYYFATSDGSLPSGPWRPFVELPNGSFYWRAFQGYTGDTLARRLGDHADALPAAVASLGGRPLERHELATNADAAWFVPGLPRVPIVVAWWNADDEFPARAELLFDTTATNHLPTDGCAVLGSWLTTMLLAHAERIG